jgi:hypothetical protein
MADRKKQDDQAAEQPRQDQPGDAGQTSGDVKVPTEEDLGLDKGYIGEKVDPRANEEYSQETDPTVSPSAAEQQADAARRLLEDREQAAKGDS